MSEQVKDTVIDVVIVVLLCLASFAGAYSGSKTSNTNRNYDYEAYCDKVWQDDKYYYEDVLSKTEQYQNYVKEHGEWWHN